MPPRLPGLVIFDLDGTLVDSRRDLALAANRLVTELGGTPLDERTIGTMIGEGVRVLLERVLAAGCGLGETDDDHLRRFRQIYAGCLLEHTLPYHGVHTTLSTLSRQLPLAVLTNKPVDPAMAILEGLDLLRYFGAVVGDGSGYPLKPAPDSVLDLAERAACELDDCLLVGDSLVDFDTARNADCAVALARYGYGYERFPLQRLEGDEVLLDEPTDLLRYLGL